MPPTPAATPAVRGVRRLPGLDRAQEAGGVQGFGAQHLRGAVVLNHGRRQCPHAHLHRHQVRVRLTAHSELRVSGGQQRELFQRRNLKSQSGLISAAGRPATALVAGTGRVMRPAGWCSPCHPLQITRHVLHEDVGGRTRLAGGGLAKNWVDRGLGPGRSMNGALRSTCRRTAASSTRSGRAVASSAARRRACHRAAGLHGPALGEQQTGGHPDLWQRGPLGATAAFSCGPVIMRSGIRQLTAVRQQSTPDPNLPALANSCALKGVHRPEAEVLAAGGQLHSQEAPKSGVPGSPPHRRR